MTDWIARRPAVIAAVLTGLLALVLVWPALSTGQLLGGDRSPDTITTIWGYWWSGAALSSASSPLSGTHSFFPVGLSPITTGLLDGVLFSPLVALLGPVGGFNVAALICLWSAGMGMWVLARAAGASPEAALIAAVGLEMSPMVVVEVQEGRLAQALVVFWLLALAGLTRLARGEGDGRLAAATGAASAAAVLVYWHSGVFLVLAAGVLWIAQYRELDRARLTRLGIAVGVCALLSGPLVVSLLAAGDPQTMAATSESLERFHRGGRSLETAIQSGLHWRWPLSAEGIRAPDRRLSAGLLALAGLALLWRRLGRWRWLAIAAVGYVIALGPYLKSASGTPRGIGLPYLLMYDYLPSFSRMSWPGRAALITATGLSVLAALGLDELGRRLVLGRRMLVVVGLVLITIDLPWRGGNLPLTIGRTPGSDDIYAQLNGPVLTTPVSSSSSTSQTALWHQLTHHQPILYGPDGYLSARRPAELDAYVEANGLLRVLSTGGRGEVSPEDVDALIASGFVWAVVDATTFPPDQGLTLVAAQARLFKELWGDPVLKGEHASAWRIAAIPTTIKAELTGAPVGGDLSSGQSGGPQGGPPQGGQQGGKAGKSGQSGQSGGPQGGPPQGGPQQGGQQGGKAGKGGGQQGGQQGGPPQGGQQGGKAGKGG